MFVENNNFPNDRHNYVHLISMMAIYDLQYIVISL